MRTSTWGLMLTVGLASAGCGLEPLPKLGETGSPGSTDTGASGVVELGALRIEPAPLAFGVVPLDEQAVQSVILTNTGEDPLIVRQANLVEEGAFEIVATTTLPLQLEEGGEVVVEVGFTPTAAETYSGALSLDVNTLDEPYVLDITGAGEGAVIDTGDDGGGSGTTAPTGGLEVAPTAVDFGEVATNIVGSFDVQLTNTHDDNILIQQINASSSEFGYRSGAGITLPQVIAPDETRTLTLTFGPNEERGYSGTVDLSLDVSGEADSLSIPVQGVGVEPPCDLCQPVVSVSPNPFQVNVPLGCSGTETATITNVGDVDMIITDVYVTNGLPACGTLSLSGTTSATLPPGGSIAVSVDFEATATLCTEIPSLARDQNVLHILQNSAQPDYTVEVNAFATCLNP